MPKSISGNAKSAAQRGKEYRARCKEEGHTPTRGKAIVNPARSSGEYKTRFQTRNFIAIDGEGENYGDEETFEIGTGTDLRTYKARDHKYTLLAASTGDELYNGGERLHARECFDFLLSLSGANKKAVFVIFSGGYDVNHMLLHDLSREDLVRISKGESVDLDFGDAEIYRVEYRSRKSLSIKKGRSFATNAKGKIVQRWAETITLWDVFGFFQESFVNTLRKWLGKDHPDYAFVERMKALRGDFENVSDKEIQEYNQAELRILVQLMDKVAIAIDNLGLTVTRWDGAGALAGAIFKKEGIKDYKMKFVPEGLETAVRTAYSGGRIEAVQVGSHNGIVHHYDVNSAYPSAMVNCPCLACGQWTHEVLTKFSRFVKPENFSVFRIKFEFPDDLPFYPLFYRNEDLSIMYPAQGEGWYWLPEYEAALEFAFQFGGNVEVQEFYEYKTACNHKPFRWIPDYYKTRQDWIQSPKEEWHNGAEKIIKLGLNSLYGKTAQQLGGTIDNPPAYFQMEWAGFITSATRSKLCMAAMQDAYAVISFATDGLFTTKALQLDTPKQKILGAWEYQTHDGITIVMPGVYWLHEPDRFAHYSRGFDKDTMRTPAAILEAWGAGSSEFPVLTRRLIGIGTAVVSDTLWQMRGRFVTSDRRLKLNMSASEKRNMIDVIQDQPHLRLVPTSVLHNYMDQISAPYPLRWIDEATTEQFRAEVEVEKEIMDTFSV